MKYKNSYEVSINFTPWMDKGYRFSKVQLVESLGGRVASGSIILESNGKKDSIELITSQSTGVLEIKDEKNNGFVLKFDVFIYKKSFVKNYLTVDFYCIKNKSFFKELILTEWNDINSAITSLYPGNVNITTESDVGNGIKIYQGTESNYSLCTKLALSYRKGVVFGYGWEGFILKDVISQGEPKIIVGPQSGNFNITPYTSEYNKLLYSEPEIILETEYSNCLVNYSYYYRVGKEYSRLMENYLFNKRYTKPSLYGTIRVVTGNSLPGFKLGDTIKFSDKSQEEKMPLDTFLVFENKLFMSIDGKSDLDDNGLNFSVTSTLLCLQENGELLPNTDEAYG